MHVWSCRIPNQSYFELLRCALSCGGCLLSTPTFYTFVHNALVLTMDVLTEPCWWDLNTFSTVVDLSFSFFFRKTAVLASITARKNPNICLPYLTISHSKGQLISKCLFGIFNSPKKWTKKFNFNPTVTQVELFSFVFWENGRHQKYISKLTDL